MTRRAPSIDRLLAAVPEHADRPAAFVLAGHNGSGKSTLWYERLADRLQRPLVNADRITAAILPPPGDGGRLPPWAQRLRDEDERWQRLSQQSVRALTSLAMAERMPFAFETVFSYWKPRPDGSHASKADDIRALQRAGYFVVLLFVGLASVDLSILRVQTRRRQGGHDVPIDKLLERFPRTQAAIGHASGIADMTLMFDNSRGVADAFTLARAQRRRRVLFDARDTTYAVDRGLSQVAGPWLDRVCGPFRPRRPSASTARH